MTLRLAAFWKRPGGLGAEGGLGCRSRRRLFCGLDRFCWLGLCLFCSWLFDSGCFGSGLGGSGFGGSSRFFSRSHFFSRYFFYRRWGRACLFSRCLFGRRLLSRFFWCLCRGSLCGYLFGWRRWGCRRCSRRWRSSHFFGRCFRRSGFFCRWFFRSCHSFLLDQFEKSTSPDEQTKRLASWGRWAP